MKEMMKISIQLQWGWKYYRLHQFELRREAPSLLNQRYLRTKGTSAYLKAAVLAECSGNGVRAATLHHNTMVFPRCKNYSRKQMRPHSPVTRPTYHTHIDISLSISRMYFYLKRNLSLTPAVPTHLSLHVSLYFSCSSQMTATHANPG